MAKRDKPKAGAHTDPAEKSESSVPSWLILLGQATAGAIAALAVIYTAYRLWITPNPAESELARVTVGYEIRQPEFLRNIFKRKFGCTEAETSQYRANEGLVQFSDTESRVYTLSAGNQADIAWVIFLRIDNYSDSPLKNVVVKTSSGTTYSSTSIPPKSFAAYFVDARSVADENGAYVAVGSDKAVVTYNVATAQGKVQTSLPREDVKQSNVAGCGPKAPLLSPQRLDDRPA